MKRFYLIFLILLCASSFAQNWRLFKTGETYNFNEDFIHGLRVDSVITNGGESHFYFNRILNDTVRQNLFSANFPVSDITQPNILGVDCIERNDSLLFKNQFGDSIYLLPQTPLNGSWNLLAKGLTQESIVATVDSVYQDSINGMLDSLKLIRLQYYIGPNSAMNAINNDIIILSKQNGIISTPNLYHTLGTPFSFNYIKPYSRNFKTLDLTNGEIYDYQVGDLVHLRIDDNIPGPPAPDYVNLEILSRTTSSNGDTLYIRIKENKEVNTANVDNSVFPPLVTITTTITTRTYTEKILHPTQPFNSKSSFEPILGYDSVNSTPMATLHVYSNQLPYSNSTYNNRLAVHIDDFSAFFDSTQNSWILNPFFTQASSHYVLEGVANYSIYSFNNGSGTILIVPNIIYFKKGTERWGNPRLVTGIENSLTSVEDISMFPNPTNHVLNLRHSNKTVFEQIQILDVKGRVVLNQNYEATIDVSSLKSGLYFIRLVGKNQMITNKFIKE